MTEWGGGGQMVFFSVSDWWMNLAIARRLGGPLMIFFLLIFSWDQQRQLRGGCMIFLKPYCWNNRPSSFLFLVSTATMSPRFRLITFDAYNTLFKPRGSLSAQYVRMLLSTSQLANLQGNKHASSTLLFCRQKKPPSMAWTSARLRSASTLD